MFRIAQHLQAQRGAVSRAEDRDAQKYENLPLSQLRETFSSFGLRKFQLNAIEAAYLATISSPAGSLIDDA